MNEFVCASCGHEQNSMDRKCDKCNSFRVILIKIAEETFGPNWRERFEEENERRA